MSWKSTEKRFRKTLRSPTLQSHAAFQLVQGRSESEPLVYPHSARIACYVLLAPRTISCRFNHKCGTTDCPPDLVLATLRRSLPSNCRTFVVVCHKCGAENLSRCVNVNVNRKSHQRTILAFLFNIQKSFEFRNTKRSLTEIFFCGIIF